jgi:hypothetical protein
MPAQAHSHSHSYSNYLPEYNPNPNTPQRPSFDAGPAQEARAAQYPATATVPEYPQYLTQHHQYPSNINPQGYSPHQPMPATAHQHHHHHRHHQRLPLENWYPSPSTMTTTTTTMTTTPESTYTTSPVPLLSSHSFHPNPTLPVPVPVPDTRYQSLPPAHQNLDNYHLLFSRPAGQLPPTSLPASVSPPSRSMPTSISPSVSPTQYPSGILAEYPVSLPPPHDDSPRQTFLAPLRNSPSSSPSNPATHHRMHHSLTCFMGRPGAPDDDITSSMPTLHQYNNLQPQVNSVFGIPTNGCNRPRHAAHGSAMNLYSPYNAPRAPSTSSPSLDQPRPHVCGICQAAFQRNHDLKRHKDVHNDTKPYVCRCGRAFTRKDALKRHMFLKSCGKDKGHESA